MTPALIGGAPTGTSWVHRARPGVKLAVLTVGLIALAVFRSAPTALLGAGGVLAIAAFARLTPGSLARQVRPVLPLALIAAGVQLWSRGPAAAITIGASCP